jgi:hypothetical protein
MQKHKKYEKQYNTVPLKAKNLTVIESNDNEENEISKNSNY